MKKATTITKKAKKLSLKQQAQFFSLLADLLAAGFSLKQSLDNVLILDVKKELLVTQVLSQLNQGNSFSEALKPWISIKTYYQLKLAEKNGDLERSLKHLGNLQNRFIEQREKINSLLFYPVMLLILLIFLGVAIKIWLSPSLKVFVEVGQKNPSQVFDKRQLIYWGWGFLGIFLLSCVVFFGKWLKQQQVLTRHNLYAKVPLVGKIYQQYSYYNLMFNLGMLLKSGLEFNEICAFLMEFSSKTLFYHFGKQLQNSLQNGESWQKISASYAFIPKELALYLNKGLTKDELSAEILFFADLSYKRLLRQLDKAISWLQPLLFLVIAGIIIGMYLSILLPMYAQIGGMYQ